MSRRWVAAIAAVVLMCQAVVVVLLQSFMGLVVNEQQMSLAGLEPHVMSIGTVVGGVVLGLCLLCCAAVLAVTAVRDRAPGRVPRLLLVSVAVLHALLGALTVGLVGWPAFLAMMLIVGLLVGTLVAYGPGQEETAAGKESEGDPAPTAEPTAG
ncbi:hypothetical protein [Streptomyces sp. TR06-5]|uniref:hypothetical protein n=1 Tax=unclassified Streptomyces TaxID=2593676 RepID=UPI00399EEDA8